VTSQQAVVTDSQYNLYVVGQHSVLCEVNWWRFVTLFE